MVKYNSCLSFFKFPSFSIILLVIIDNTPTSDAKKKPVSTVSAIHKAWETLQWDQPLNLIGRGIVDPLIHICEQCDLPILIYGRMVSDLFQINT